MLLSVNLDVTLQVPGEGFGPDLTVEIFDHVAEHVWNNVFATERERCCLRCWASAFDHIEGGKNKLLRVGRGKGEQRFPIISFLRSVQERLYRM